MSSSSKREKSSSQYTHRDPEQPDTHRGILRRISGLLLAHPNGAIIAVTLFVIAVIAGGSFVTTKDFENRLTDAVFRTNALTSDANASHLKSYLESRADGIRSLAGTLTNDNSLSQKASDMESYFNYVKGLNVAAIMLLSPSGTVIYSTAVTYSDRDFSRTRFWNYVTRTADSIVASEVRTKPGEDLSSIPPFAGSGDTGPWLIIGSPIFKVLKGNKVRFDGAVAFLADQYRVVPSPGSSVLELHNITSRIAVGIFAKSGFPFIHLWSNVSSWNSQSIKELRKNGRESCASCHRQGDIDMILGGTTQLGTALMKTNAANSENDEFLWTSSKITSSRLFLQDSVWYMVVSADRAPIQALISSYVRGSTILMIGTITLLVIILSLGFYAQRRNSLERQRAEHLEHLANVREQYELLIEKSNDGIYILFENKIIFANKKFQDLFGYPLEELTDLDFLQLIAPESRNVIEKRVEKFSRGQKIESRYGFIALSKDGRRIPVEVSVTHVPHEGKVRTIGIVRDLSELTAQKQLYEDLFEYAPIGLAIYRSFKAIKVNNTAVELLGYNDPDELIGAHVLQFVHPDDLPTVRQQVEEAMASHTPAPPMEEKLLRKDGSSFYALVLSQPVIYEGENAIQIAFVSLEDRKRLEENLAREAALQEQEKLRLDTLLQSLDEGILFQKPDGEIEFANAEFCRIFGFDNPSQVIGRHSDDIVVQAAKGTKHPEEFIERVTKDVERRDSVQADRVEFVDGTIVERSAFPIFSPMDRYAGRLAIFRDITSRIQREEAIKRLQRTELLGRLAGGIAHDFNNVLAIIIGSLQMILRKLDNPTTVQENTQRALSSAIRGSEVAKRLLQFVRYSPEGFKVFSVRQIVEETVSIIKHTFQENIAVRTEFLIRDAHIHGSSGDIQQVLINLANNSRDAMPNGGTLTISLTTPDKKNVQKMVGTMPISEYALVMVQDTGQGIEPDKLEKIFDPFFTTKDIGKGTGLGLSIVQTIVSAHAGFIEVKSQPGAGTAFLIYLPMSKETPQPSQALQRHETEEAEDIARAATILVVEDETGLRDLLCEYLSDNGFNVIGVADGEEGLETFDGHPEISVILSDLGLPRLSGDKMLAKVKAKRPDVRCILATGYLTPAADGNLADLDVNMVMKPYNLTAIHNLLIDILSKQPPGASPNS